MDFYKKGIGFLIGLSFSIVQGTPLPITAEKEAIQKQLYLKGSLGVHVAESGAGPLYGGGIYYCYSNYIFSSTFEFAVDLTKMFSTPIPSNLSGSLHAGKIIFKHKYSECNASVGIGISKIIKDGKLVESGWLGSIYDPLVYYTPSFPISLEYGFKYRFIGIGITPTINLNYYMPYAGIMLDIKLGKLN